MPRESFPQLPYDLQISYAVYDGTDIAIVAETKEAVFTFYWDGASAAFRTQRVQAKVPISGQKK